MSFEQISETLQPYLENILRFRFEVFDPVFWLFILIIFFFAVRMWGNKRALSFSLVVAASLVINTYAEDFVARVLYRPDDLFRFIIRGITVLFIFTIGIYYTFLKSDY
jgi:hypothetical protein